MLHFSVLWRQLIPQQAPPFWPSTTNPELLELVRGCLEPDGFQVYTASSAKEGIDFYEKNWRDIRLVLLDFLQCRR